MGLYEIPLSMSLLGFEIATMLANFHMCGIMVLLRAVLKMLVRNASPRVPMCFRCLMCSLSVPGELLFCLVLLPLRSEVVSVMLYPCIFCITMGTLNVRVLVY